MIAKRHLVSYGLFLVVALFFFLQLSVTVRHFALSHKDDIIVEDENKNISLAYVLGGHSWTRTWFLVHLKSIFAHSLQNLNLHIIIDKETRNDVELLLNTWNLSRVNYYFYDLTPHLNSVNWIPTYHYSKNYALAKILLPSIVDKSVEKVILLDVDTILRTDILHLWNNFKLMNDSQIFGLTENLSDWYLNKDGRRNVWSALGRGFNAGVMLIDLEKLRNVDWEHIWRNSSEEQLRLHGATTTADQDIYNSIFVQHPEWVHKIGCGYNYQLGSRSKASTLCREDPLIIHFNSENKTVSEKFDEFETLRQNIENISGDLIKSTRNGLERKPISENEKPFCSEYIPHQKFRVLPNALGVPKWNESESTCLCVQLSYDRLSSFIRETHHWPFSISVAIYGSDEEVFKMLNEIKKLGRTNIAVHLVFRQTPEKTYPINFLRNIAIRYAKTENIILADVDFLVLGDLPTLMEMGRNISEKEVIVIPAFEIKENVYDFDKYKLPTTKSEVKELIESNKIQVFRENIWPTAHRATNLDKWLSSNDSYRVLWKKNYEPYILIRRSEVPFYDERFGGFGWNKVTHIMELKLKNFTFIVDPSSFLIHQPHSPSQDLVRFRASLKYRQCLQHLKHEFIKEATEKFNSKRSS